MTCLLIFGIYHIGMIDPFSMLLKKGLKILKEKSKGVNGIEKGKQWSKKHYT